MNFYPGERLSSRKLNDLTPDILNRIIAGPGINIIRQSDHIILSTESVNSMGLSESSKGGGSSVTPTTGKPDYTKPPKKPIPDDTSFIALGATWTARIKPHYHPHQKKILVNIYDEKMQRMKNERWFDLQVPEKDNYTWECYVARPLLIRSGEMQNLDAAPSYDLDSGMKYTYSSVNDNKWRRKVTYTIAGATKTELQEITPIYKKSEYITLEMIAISQGMATQYDIPFVRYVGPDNTSYDFMFILIDRNDAHRSWARLISEEWL